MVLPSLKMVCFTIGRMEENHHQVYAQSTMFFVTQDSGTLLG